MNTFFKKLTAITASAVIAVCSSSVGNVFSADDDKADKQLVIHFDLSGEGISIVEDDYGNVPVLEDILTAPSSSEKIPRIYLEKENYVFQGWTPDGVYGYQPGNVIRTADEDITLTPVFSLKKDPNLYSCQYVVEMDGEVLDTKGDLPTKKYRPNEFVVPSFQSYQNSEKRSIGWTDGEHEYLQEQKFLMPDHDVILTPIWHNYRVLTFDVGDADNIVGAKHIYFDVIEGLDKDLPDDTRFSRKGYNIIGWHCEYDNKDYPLRGVFIMPDEDVTMTPIWEPIQYNVMFRSGISGVDSIKVPGKTGEIIKVPAMEHTKEGYTFGGWTYNGKTYQTGDDFLVEGVIRGLGIAPDAIWIANTESTTITSSATTTSSTSTSTSTSTETTTSTSTVTSTESTSTNVTTTGDILPDRFKEVKFYPEKTVYEVGEKLSFKGLEVEYYKGSNEDDVQSTKLLPFEAEIKDSNGQVYEYSDFKTLPAGKYTVSVSDFIVYTTTPVSSDAKYMNDTDISFDVEILDKNYMKLEVLYDDGTPAKDVIITYNHNMSYTMDDGQVVSTGPIKHLDTSLVNPLIIPKSNEKGSSASLSGFSYSKGYHDDVITKIDDSAVKQTIDKDKNIIVYTITLKSNNSAPDYGDANCDGKVNLSDAVLILQSIANPDKYGVKGTDSNALTEKGKANADVSGNNDGVTSADALAIQKFMLNLITKLPE